MVVDASPNIKFGHSVISKVSRNSGEAIMIAAGSFEDGPSVKIEERMDPVSKSVRCAYLRFLSISLRILQILDVPTIVNVALDHLCQPARWWLTN